MQLHRQNLPTPPDRLRRRCRRAATPRVCSSLDPKQKNTRTGPRRRRSCRGDGEWWTPRAESRGGNRFITRTKVHSTASIRRRGEDGVRIRGTARGTKAAVPCGTKRTATWNAGTLSWITISRTWTESTSLTSAAAAEYVGPIHELGHPCDDAYVQCSRTSFEILVPGNIEALRVAARSYVGNG